MSLFVYFFSITYGSGIKPAVVQYCYQTNLGGVMRITGHAMRSLGKFMSIKAMAMVLAFLGSVAFSSVVWADITPIFTGVTGGPAVFTFNYTIAIGGPERAQPGPGLAPSGVTPGLPASAATAASVADYVTIYDFNGFNGTETHPIGWAFTSALVGATPQLTNPVDSISVVNLTWYRTGATLAGPQTLTGFSANTTVGTSIQTGFFTSDATKNAAGDPQDGFPVQTASFTTVPTPPAPPAIPEPTTLLLLGSGLAGLAGWRHWRAKK